MGKTELVTDFSGMTGNQIAQLVEDKKADAAAAGTFLLQRQIKKNQKAREKATA